MENKFIKITCPHCGAEYTLDEIYISKYLTGASNAVVKNALGKILAVDYDEEPDLSEQYICDYCNKEFNVDLEIKVKTEDVEEEVNFTSTEPVSLF